MNRIVIDSDPGIDDAMAIMLALSSPGIQVDAITTVFGNVELDLCTKNALRILEVADRTEIPVAPGAAKPLVKEDVRDARFVHGDNGLGDVELPEPQTRPIDMHAVDFIIDRIMSNPGEISIVALGPLTNVALAICREPRIVKNAKELVFMGGVFLGPGNASPVASANVLSDPEALKVVLDSGVCPTLVGLDVTTRVTFTEGHMRALRARNPRVGAFIADVCEFRVKLARKRLIDGNEAGFISSDAVTMTYVVQPSFFRAQMLPVDVETKGRLTYGETVADFSGHWGKGPNAKVCLEIDAQAVAEFYVQQLTQGEGMRNQ